MISIEKKLLKIYKRQPDAFIRLISANYNLSQKFIDKFKHFLNWSEISNNPHVSKDTLDKYRELINTYSVKNRKKKIFSKHPEKINISISASRDLIWTISLIEEYFDQIEWHILSKNPEVAKSENILEHYYDLWDWTFLSVNEGLPLSIELIERYENRWNYSYLMKNPVFWKNICEPYLNETFLEKVLEEILNKEKKENFFTYFSI